MDEAVSYAALVLVDGDVDVCGGMLGARQQRALVTVAGGMTVGYYM